MPSDVLAIGIDLGTTNSCVGVVRNGRVDIIANEMGDRTTPSFVAFTDSKRLIGTAAKEQAADNTKNTVFDAKRLIGRKFNDPDVQKLVSHWPFIVKDFSNTPKFSVEYKGEVKVFTPEQISAMVLIRMKEVAETYIGEEVKDAVITVPVYFNDSQRQATIDAGTVAGLNVLSIITEPTAAAIAYGVEKKFAAKRNILIFDMGGGTFDVVILKIENGSFDVLAVNGDTFLGGSDIDNLLVQHFITEFEKRFKCKLNLIDNSRAVGKLREECEKVKRRLSASKNDRIHIDSFHNGQDFNCSISRVRFEEICSDLFRKTLNPVETVLRDAKLDKSEIDEVVLAGGSTRIPKIQLLLQDFFQGKKLNKTINPDEAVAYGAACHAAALAGEPTMKNIELQDVTPLSLGTEVLGNYTSCIIPRNSKIPTKKTKKYTTVVENQESVDIKVYEGEKTLCIHNNIVGSFLLEGIQVAKVGVPQIEVTFAVDNNGILTVSAMDVSTGSQKSITITSNKGRLKQDEIKQMMVETQKFRDDDQNYLLDIEARGDLELYCMKMRITTMKRHTEEKISDDIRDTIIKACDEALTWLENNQNASKEECVDQKETLEQGFINLA